MGSFTVWPNSYFIYIELQETKQESQPVDFLKEYDLEVTMLVWMEMKMN